MKTLITSLCIAALAFAGQAHADSDLLGNRSIESLNALHNQLAEIREYNPRIYRGPEQHRLAREERQRQESLQNRERLEELGRWKENYQASAY